MNQQVPTVNFDTLPLGESQIPEVGIAWKFGSEVEAVDFMQSFQAPTGSPEGKVLPLFFFAGGHYAVVYLYLLAWARAHKG